MQVDPIKPKLKPPGTRHLKLNCSMLLSTFAFKFNLRRSIKPKLRKIPDGDWQGLTLVHFLAQRKHFL